MDDAERNDNNNAAYGWTIEDLQRVFGPAVGDLAAAVRFTRRPVTG